jgi:hypothetical protein
MEVKGIQMEKQHKGNDIANKFLERGNKGQIEYVLNSNISTYDNFQSTKQCKIVLIPDKQVESYRYMYQTRILEGIMWSMGCYCATLNNYL